MKIGFVGNCQTIQLCSHYQKIYNDSDNIRWICYNTSFLTSIKKGDGCRNKIIDEEGGIEFIKSCDIIVYQKINELTSPLFHKDIIQTYNPSAKYISIPSMYFNCDKYDQSFEELKKREEINKVDITITDIIENNKDEKLFITFNQPSDLLILKVVNKLDNFF